MNAFSQPFGQRASLPPFGLSLSKPGAGAPTGSARTDVFVCQ